MCALIINKHKTICISINWVGFIIQSPEALQQKWCEIQSLIL